MQQPLSSDGIVRDSSKQVDEENRNATTSYRKMENADPNYPLEVDKDDDVSMAMSIASSVMTADGIEDPTGFAIVCLAILIGDMSRGVMFPSLWQLVEALGGTSVTQGYAVAAFSFGRILVSPMFGTWSVTHGYSQTLLISCSILLLGTLFYAQAQNVGRPEFLILSQTLLGIGSGTLGVTRAFVAEVTATRNRTTYMAWITAVQYAGFTVTPFVGAFFNKVLEDTDVNIGWIRINMFTAPAYFMSITVALTIYMLLMHFQDRARSQNPKDIKKMSAKRAAIDDHANQMTMVGLSIYDCCIVGCMLLNVATKGSIGCFETLGISIAESLFGISSTMAGTIVGSCGTIGVISLLSMGKISQFLSDIQMICGGMFVMAIGILSLTFVEENGDNPSWVYMLSFFLIYSIGYPISHTAVISLFSKIVGRRPQGTLLGWFASAGSLARLVFPVVSGYVEHYLGIVTLFYILTGVLGVSTVVTLYNQKTLTMLSQ
ncbi:unnamed protein product [Cylindrotheca closterium]|uniref:Major facilitator superfamily (MFS) profile domain-containing protein n=1 Tax=Cylindrotheca closterium TaxID=2856 RepID=A0AAD2G8D0_9STRA|nr:unnamed protein product [Cylindrotheca closterium]